MDDSQNQEKLVGMAKKMLFGLKKDTEPEEVSRMDDFQKLKMLIGYIERLRTGDMAEREPWIYNKILVPMFNLKVSAPPEEVLAKLITAFLNIMNKDGHWLLDPKPALFATIGMNNWLPLKGWQSYSQSGGLLWDCLPMRVAHLWAVTR